jgi:hypothetical protein
MNLSRQAFRPDWSRIFLDTALDQALSNLTITKGNCLNVGCGTAGRYRELLSGYEVDGVDIADPQDITMPWRYHRCDSSRLPFADAEFDLAVAIESFEHIEKTHGPCRKWLGRSSPVPGWQSPRRRIGLGYSSLDAMVPTITIKRHCPSSSKVTGLKWFLAKPAGVFWLANLLKSWLSPIGYRHLHKKWWTMIDTALLPIYCVSRFTDRLLVFLPTNWLMVAKKSGD